MDRNEIFERLNNVFADVFDDDTITVSEDTTAADIDGWDSLMHITLISAVEDEFDIKFDMKSVVAMKNVGDMADVIEHKIRCFSCIFNRGYIFSRGFDGKISRKSRHSIASEGRTQASKKTAAKEKKADCRLCGHSEFCCSVFN